MSYIALGNCYKVTLEELREIAADFHGIIHHVYAHWTAGHYSQAYDDYHICIDHDGSVYLTTEDFTDILAHTWHRNTGAIGIALMCAYRAEARNGYNAWLGPEPPTDIQITALAQVTAVLSEELGLEINDDNYMTHAEAADIDDYGPSSTCERWDLWYLPDSNNCGQLVDGGQLWRGMAIWYMNQWRQRGEGNV